MESEQFEGEWFSPDSPEKRASGIAKYRGNDNGLEESALEIFGTFGDKEAKDLYPDGEEAVPRGILWGNTTKNGIGEGGKVTILNSDVTDIEGVSLVGSSYLPTIKYRFSEFFVGGHFKQNSKFGQFLFKLDNLSNWFNKVNFEYDSGSEDQSNIRGRYEIKESENICIPLENAEIELSFEPHMQRKSHEVSINDSTKVRVKPDSPITYHEFRYNFLQPIKRYVAFGTGSPVHPTLIKGFSDGESIRILPYVATHNPKKSSYSNRKARFQPDDVNLVDSIRNWFKRRDDAKILYHSYFGSMYNTYQYTDYKFLSLVVALESYHATLYPDRELMDKDDYNDLREEIVENIPEHVGARDRIDGLLGGGIGNIPSLRDQLQEVMEYDQMDQIISQFIDIGSTVGKVRDARHDIAHGLNEGNASIETFAKLNPRLQLVIDCLLMNVAGVQDEKILASLASGYRLRNEN